MPHTDFSHVRTWVFDLDNTLYPPETRLFDLIEVRMTAFVMDVLSVGRHEADRLRRHYWRTYGTTLSGLMTEHGIAPDGFLADVHDISLDRVRPDADLAAAIAALPGRKIVHTNAAADYGRRVLAARGLADVIEAVYGIEHAGYCPKPRREAYLQVCDLAQVEPADAAMFEDDARNLAEPHALGMRTVHVAPDSEPADHIHHHTDDLAAFLARLSG
jgi:putative hydrolase of the HAD superfamily